ncbi:MAG TPA: TolC family protein, partial [Planctomycetota bacterium]|nr:TolC family protein [Planctomycetota bacterium]
SFRIAENGAAVTRARQAAGDALPEEVARAEMEQIRVRLDLDRIRSLRGQAAVALASALGDSGVRIESVRGTLEMTLEIPALEAIQDSVGRHPALGAAAADVAAQRARIELAESQRVPDVTLDLFYRRLQHSEGNAFDVGLTIPLPVFDRNQGRLREARAETSAAEARLRLTRNELLRELRQAHGRLASALGAARTLKDEILPRAETVLKGAETRYAAGDLSLPDLIPIRRERASLQLNYLESLREVMEAWAELKPFLEAPAR